jgi:hypothetical protein
MSAIALEKLAVSTDHRWTTASSSFMPTISSLPHPHRDDLGTSELVRRAVSIRTIQRSTPQRHWY